MTTPILKKFNGLAFVLVGILLLITGCKQKKQTQQAEIDIPADSVLARTINSQLEQTDHMMVDSLEIGVQNGIVLLKGTVDNLLTKKRAGDVAEQVHGVLSVVNNLDVETTRSDAQIQNDVATALRTDPATEEMEIHVSVNNGKVTLKGSVDSWQEKRLARKIAMSVKGVTEIRNDIVVGYNELREPRHIKAEVRKMLKWDPRISDKGIKVQVDDYTVVLSGHVGSLKEKRIAERIAHVTGVRKVISRDLRVRPSLSSELTRKNLAATVSDKQIENAIMRSMRYDPRVDTADIRVEVNDGVATLTGSVNNLIAKINAQQNAINTVGVGKVKNKIRVERKIVVRPEVPTTDKGIKSRISAMINRDPYVELVEVDIKVNDGHVTLEGQVNSKYEKTHIEKLAQRVKGVVSIENHISIVQP